MIQREEKSDSKGTSYEANNQTGTMTSQTQVK
jgi:hypothetical protein